MICCVSQRQLIHSSSSALALLQERPPRDVRSAAIHWRGGAILYPVFVHQTERGIRWQGRACACLPEVSQNAPRRARCTRIAHLAHVVLDVGAATPYRRRRIRTLARERRDILKRMEEVGLIMPRPPAEKMDHDDIDPMAAWDEWVEYARSGDDERL